MRRALASTMNTDSMGFADPDRDGRQAPPIPMVASELEGGMGVGRTRDSAGRFVGASDELSPESRALRESGSEHRALRESGPGGVDPSFGADGAPASPTATIFATTGGGGGAGGDGDLMPSSHAHIKYILANQEAKATACANIASVGGSFRDEQDGVRLRPHPHRGFPGGRDR